MPDQPFESPDQIHDREDADIEGAAKEVANQLKQFEHEKKPGFDAAINVQGVEVNGVGELNEKERNEALNKAATSLDQMVKGDIPHLRKRLTELGVSTAELDAVEKKLSAKVEAAKPVQEAILKGDLKGLQKMVASMKPEDIQANIELIQKHFDQVGMGLVLDYTDGKLIISRTSGDRAVSIAADKVDVIGINPDGSYSPRDFRRENPAEELQGMASSSLRSFLWPKLGIRDQWGGEVILPHQLPRYYPQPHDVYPSERPPSKSK